MTRTAATAGEKALRGALVLAGILLIGANLRAALTAVGPVLELIRQDLGLGADAASLLISLPLMGFAVVSPLAPVVSRRLGLEWSLAGSLVLLGVATAWRSLPLPGALWLGTVGLGAAIAMLNVLLPVLVKQWYPRHIGPVTGVYTAVQSGVGGLAAGVAVPLAALSSSGWRLALGIWAALALMALAVYWPQLRHARTTGAQASPAAVDEVTAAVQPPLRSVWRSPLAWQVALFMGLQSTVYYTIITWWPAIEAHHGVSPAVAGWHQVVLQLVAVVSSLVAAALLHRLRQQSALIAVVTLLALGAVVGQLLAPALALLWIVCLGFFGGVAIVVALSLFGLRTRDYRQAASLSGMAQSVGYLLAAVLGPFFWRAWCANGRIRGWRRCICCWSSWLGFWCLACWRDAPAMSIRVVVIAGSVSAGVVGDEVSRRSVTMCRRPARVSTGRPQRAVVSRLTAEWLRSAALDRFGGGWL